MKRDHPFEEVYTPSGLDADQGAWFVGPTLSRRRLSALTIILFVVFGALLLRSADLMIIQGAFWSRIAQRNHTRTIALPAARGEIRDHHGRVLATNTPVFTAIIFPDRLPKEVSDRSALLTSLASIIGVSLDDLASAITNAKGAEYAVVREDLTHEQALPLMATLPNEYASVLFRPERHYVDDDGRAMIGNVIGFTGRVGPDEYQQMRARGYRQDDLIGKQGVERAYEEQLRGINGEIAYDVGADGSIQGEQFQHPPTAGGDITLTIDLELHKRIAQAIARFAHGKNGAVIVEDIPTGALRALVSFPDFSSNSFVGARDSKTIEQLLTDAHRPLYFRAISGQYPPGSTIKPFYATGALSDGAITPATTVNSRGGIRLGDSSFPDWKAGGHGMTDVSKALAESVNTFFYLAMGGYPLRDGQYPRSTGIGVSRMGTILKAFGFMAPTGVDLFGESIGFFPSEQWKQEIKRERWYIGDTYHLAIGQGDLLVTPLQLVSALVRIATGGKAKRPVVVERLTDTRGNVLRQIASDPLSSVDFREQAFATVRAGMRRAVTSGSARQLADLPIAVAGKTGTAQWSSRMPTHSWFIGFGPYEHPQIALAVLVEEGGEGSGPALSIAKEIFQWYAEHPSEL